MTIQKKRENKRFDYFIIKITAFNDNQILFKCECPLTNNYRYPTNNMKKHIHPCFDNVDIECYYENKSYFIY